MQEHKRTVRALLAGCGQVSGAWLHAARGLEDLEIAALVDLVEDRARQRAEEFDLPDALVACDLEAALRRAAPDVVFDCTVPEAHVGVAEVALEAGCHVLGEKPLAHSMEAAGRIVEAAKRAGRIHAVIQNRRYDANIRRVRRFIEGGALGPLTTLNADFYIGAHFGGFRDRMKHVLLLDMAIHTFDAARFISGADPLSVYCREWNPEGSWYDHGASAVAVFEMEGGLAFTYRGSWCAEGLNTDWGASWHAVGTRGSLKWDGGAGLQAQVVRKTGGFLSECEEVQVPPFEGEAFMEGHAGVIQEFVRCVQEGGIPETVCTDNIKSLAMVFGAVESAETGEPVEIRI
jgi:predicted dehydrogenase